jgi:hypothetical protein
MSTNDTSSVLHPVSEAEISALKDAFAEVAVGFVFFGELLDIE